MPYVFHMCVCVDESVHWWWCFYAAFVLCGKTGGKIKTATACRRERERTREIINNLRDKKRGIKSARAVCLFHDAK